MFIGVIADDLTSAADGGAPFARAGHTVFVRFPDSSAPLTRDADVVAMDLDSRARPEAEAAALAAAAAAACLAEVARSLAADGLVDGLIATGGDTARAAAGALGARGLRLWGEMEPGVPVGILDGPHPLPVITKAGGFGDQGTLVRLCKALCNPVSPLYRERLST